ncbi:HAD family hydrolase [Paenibacillus senegalensis]|uniref:haloacid dehalogenase n=1 Tax=Paenibacillus senegalensis TaxID=1465766 RepID=UPI00028A0892|nr:haloacid dehalogenase [Paenibacillus senegalensis]
MYKAILFDLDNTLLDYDLSEMNCMKRALHQHEVMPELAWETFWEVFAPINFGYWIERPPRNESPAFIVEHLDEIPLLLERKNQAV